MTSAQVRTTAATLQAALAADPKSKDKVKAFLRSEGFVDFNFDADPVSTIFRYLAEAPKEG